MSYIFNKATLWIIIIVAVIFVTSTNEIVKLVKKMNAASVDAYTNYLISQQTMFRTQEECQRRTGAICESIQCDPTSYDITYEELCKKSFQGKWRATNVPIPTFFQNLEVIRLTVGTKTATETIGIRVPDNTSTYTLTLLNGTTAENKTQTMTPNDITRLVNKIILYDLAHVSDVSIETGSQDTAYTLYFASRPRSLAGGQTDVQERTIECAHAQCSREFISIMKAIRLVWDKVDLY